MIQRNNRSRLGTCPSSDIGPAGLRRNLPVEWLVSNLQSEHTCLPEQSWLIFSGDLGELPVKRELLCALWEFFARIGPGHATGSAWTWHGVGTPV